MKIISSSVSDYRGTLAKLSKCILICSSSIALLACSSPRLPNASEINSHSVNTEKDLGDEMSPALSFVQEPYVHPAALIRLLVPLTPNDIEDVDATVLVTGNRSPYDSPITTHSDDNGGLWIHTAFVDDDQTNCSISYRHLGDTTSGIPVLHVAYWPGGSGIFEYIVLVEIKRTSRWEYADEMPLRPMRSSRLVLISKSCVFFADRFAGKVKMEGNILKISKRQVSPRVENGCYVMHYGEYEDWQDFMIIP